MPDLGIFRQKVEQEIRSLLVGTSTPVFGIDAMNAYHMGFTDCNGNPVTSSKGKYMRPLFCIAVCAGLGGDPEKAIPPAASLEITHRTSLIFDDIQDAGQERNGRPTVSAIWGTSQAINAGLALSSQARLAAQKGNACGLTNDTILSILSALENAVIHLCQGQYSDLSFGERVNLPRDDYLRMVEGKTGSLFGAAGEIGALCAGADLDKVAAARELGFNMGVAFQIHDDYLGVWGDEEVVGKTANDLAEKKRALPVVLALEQEPERIKYWLSSNVYSQKVLEELKAWMEEAGIKERVQQMEAEHIQKAQQCLNGLRLAPDWHSEISRFLTLVVERVK